VKVRLFVRDGDIYSDEARNLLEKNEIDYEEINCDLEKNINMCRNILNVVPTLEMPSGELITGYFDILDRIDEIKRIAKKEKKVEEEEKSEIVYEYEVIE